MTTKEDILKKAKYVLIESYNSKNEDNEKYHQENKSLILDFLKDKQYLKLGDPDPSTRCAHPEQAHHYLPNFHYKNLETLMSYIGVKEFNYNDFVSRELIEFETGDDFSYLYHIMPIKYKITTSRYKYNPNEGDKYVYFYPNEDIINCDYTFLSEVRGYNHCANIYYPRIQFGYYHRLNYMAHDFGIIENLTTTNNKTLLVSCDSQAIPFLSILSCYYKKLIVLDKRVEGFFTSWCYENENVDDVLIFLTYDNPPQKFIKFNLD